MARKPLKAKSTQLSLSEVDWRKAFEDGICPVGGCELRTTLCGHINSYLNDSKRQSIHADSKFDIDIAMQAEFAFDSMLRQNLSPAQETEHTAGLAQTYDDFVARLQDYFLSELEVSVLTELYYFGYTYRQIAIELEIPSATVVFNIKTEALRKLKERGFGG